jgi:hypothetical protein
MRQRLLHFQKPFLSNRYASVCKIIVFIMILNNCFEICMRPKLAIMLKSSRTANWILANQQSEGCRAGEIGGLLVQAVNDP